MSAPPEAGQNNAATSEAEPECAVFCRSQGEASLVYMSVSRSPVRVTRRRFFEAAAATLAFPRTLRAAQPASRERLYNGIVLASPWPPRAASLPETEMTPAYLMDPPEVIDIDVGRQLFVDDFLIEESSLYRTFNKATYHPASPVLTPLGERERRDPHAEMTGTPSSPAAMVFSDGVFFDPADRIYKMWYMAGYQQHTALALSRDGIQWERPALDVVRGTNIVSTEARDSSAVWLELDARDAEP